MQGGLGTQVKSLRLGNASRGLELPEKRPQSANLLVTSGQKRASFRLETSRKYWVGLVFTYHVGAGKSSRRGNQTFLRMRKREGRREKEGRKRREKSGRTAEGMVSEGLPRL